MPMQRTQLRNYWLASGGRRIRGISVMERGGGAIAVRQENALNKT